MLSKNCLIFGLIVSFVYPVHAYLVAQPESSETDKTFCEYDLGDWYGYTKYDSKADVIHMQKCIWGMGYSCSEYNIEKLMEQDGIKVYYSTNGEFFIKDDNNKEFEDGWHWKNPDCEEGYKQYGLTEYAFTYACPYTPPEKPKQLLIIDKKDKVYAIDVSEKNVKIFSGTDQPIFYKDYKALCE